MNNKCTGTTETKCIRCDTPKSEWKGRWEEPLCKVGRQTFDSHTVTTETTLEERFEELWSNNCIEGNKHNPTDTMYYEGFMSAIYKYAMYVRDEELAFAVQQERERCVEAVKETMRYSSIEMKLSALVGIFGRDVIQAINQEEL